MEQKRKLRQGSGKKSARERLEKLFDPDSFVEIGLFVKHRCANFGMEKKELPGDGVVTGYGTINGRLTFAAAQDFTVLGGSLGEMHAAKIANIQELAIKAQAPIICINDSGGARIQEGVDALAGYGRIFYNNTRASGVIPQLSVIMGTCAGGAVYSPALTDFVFMVKNSSQMFITGPQVIKAATREEITGELLGGANTHSTISGCAHFSADSEEDCIAQIHKLLSFLPQNNTESAPECRCTDGPGQGDKALDQILPPESRRPYDMLSIVRSLADNGDMLEYQSSYACNIITAFIRLGGKSVGVIANQPKVAAGCLDINAADKASRFIRTCDAFNIPLLTLEDVPGFLPGKQQEYGGIIRHGAKMLYAYSEATVPKVTVIIRKAYGGAYISMCSKHLGADMVFAWPEAEIAVMGAEGAANVIFSREIRASADPEAVRSAKIQEYQDTMMNPYIAAARGYVDDIILPSETRKQVMGAFRALANKQTERLHKKHGNIPL